MILYPKYYKLVLTFDVAFHKVLVLFKLQWFDGKSHIELIKNH